MVWRMRVSTMSDRPEIDFDHHSPECNEDPVAAYEAIRTQCPVAWSNRHGGFWLISDRVSLQRVMRDTETFVNRRTEYTPEGTIAITLPPLPAPFIAYPDESDPPLWKEYRAIVNEVLSRQAVEGLRPIVERWTGLFIDRVIEQGSCDLMYDLASPMPACVMLEFLGFPTEHWERYSLTLHDENDDRILGYDNSHGVDVAWGPAKRAKRPEPFDHIDRRGRRSVPYRFTTPYKLVEDFFTEVERILKEEGVL